ncbi:thiolase family protein [Ramlibacter sp.]|uniref:thiolase family protein n=1 Tax=Ramlibacter sp. TaxID=1917967 RepID=UPI002D1D1CF4|nr:thiolase family protein [Ramlibacter sp.]HWI80502.1 thiolase family protein [Ramlibacter sp.]
MHDPVIVDAIRTPFARRGGAYRALRPDALLAAQLRQLVDRSGVTPARIGDIVAGCVSQAGEQAANVGRQAALLAGLPVEVPAVTLNRMCGSGQTAVHLAAQAVAAGDVDYAIACGVESMSRVPMFLDVTLGEPFRDWSSLNPDLLRQHQLPHQGESAELMAARWCLSREVLDEFAAESHRKAHASAAIGGRETVPLPPSMGPAGELRSDEGVRANVDREKMAQLAPLFRPQGGVITAGNASQMTDGAAALLVGDAARARADGLKPRARFRARVVVGSDPRIQLDGVIPATRAALARAGVGVQDIDWIEVNEAFACVPIAWARELGVDLADVNPWGGAIAHGHPLGATGVGLTAKALAGLEATGGTLGLVVFCVGHGMATATVLERI